MISLARSPRCKTYMQSKNAASALARRFVGGHDPAEAVAVAGRLGHQGIHCSLFYLGEYAETEKLVAENLTAKLDIALLLARAEQDIHISVDPTQLGCSIDWSRGVDNIYTLAKKVAQLSKTSSGLNCVMLDMEDYAINKKTIALYDRLIKDGLKAALTLQAYLRKTEQDIRQKIQQGATVRLVKGAFAAGPEIAFTSSKEIRNNYIHLIHMMLGKKARQTGFYPIFATHDHKLHDYAIRCARENDWPAGSYEFEMLYGVRNDVARNLADRGEKIRLYLPFGQDWWPYAVRRIGENPGSIPLLFRSLFNG